MRNKILAIIPARLNSSRFPNKVIQPLLGKPLIYHVYFQAKRSKNLDEVIVATDDQKVMDICKEYSIKAILTSKSHRSGTERLTEVSQKMKASIYLNIQGDEPLIDSSMIDQLIEPYLSYDFNGIATLKKKISTSKEIHNPNIVKVVCNNNNEALYFSRSPIPYSKTPEKNSYYKHIGIYAYSQPILNQISRLNPCEYEKIENLEQLRFLYYNIPVKVLETKIETIGVDTPEDLMRVEKILEYRSKKSTPLNCG